MEKKFGLCYRCEHRARFIENGHGPRCECGDVDRAVSSCYMYLPVVPVITKPLNTDDPRPVYGPPMIAGRVVYSKLADINEEIFLNLHQIDEGYLALWERC